LLAHRSGLADCATEKTDAEARKSATFPMMLNTAHTKGSVSDAPTAGAQLEPSGGVQVVLKACDAGVRALIEGPFHLCGFSFQFVAPAQSCRRPSMDAAVQLAALRAENARLIELLAAKDQLITHLITSKAELVTCKDELLASRTAELQNPRRLPAVQHFETYL
jgi:hypothetical protein